MNKLSIAFLLNSTILHANLWGKIYHVEVSPILDFRLIYVTFTLKLSHLQPKNLPKVRKGGLVGAFRSTNVRASFVFVMMYPIQKRIRCHVDWRIDLKVHPSTIDANHRGMNTHAWPAIFPEMVRQILEKNARHQRIVFLEKQKTHQDSCINSFLVPLIWVNS